MFLRRALGIAAGCALAGCAADRALTPLPSGSSAMHARTSAIEAVLYSFKAGTDGADPLGNLIADGSGALYGTTEFGGNSGCFGGCGTVFKLTPFGSTYAETVIYRFKGSSSGDGSGPGAGLVADTSGALYGTTEYGGNASGNGTVFKLTPSGSVYNETVLHVFSSGKDGNAPIGGLTIDSHGNLYGATLLGGNAPGCGQNGTGAYIGCGIIFEMVRSGSAYKEHVLYRFQGGSDGATPGSPPILVGKRLYGTAATGGTPSCGGAPINPGCGTAYELTRGKRATLTVLHEFAGSPSDGANAFQGLVRDRHGVFYGTTQYGGSSNTGSAFSLVRSGSTYKEKMLHSFTGGNDGEYPLAPLVIGKGGTLYGVTEYGGSIGDGVAFELQKAHGQYAESLIYEFATRAGGEYPVGGLLLGANGVLYGTTSYGGSASSPAGTAFSLAIK